MDSRHEEDRAAMLLEPDTPPQPLLSSARSAPLIRLMSWSIGLLGCADLLSAILPPSALRSDLLLSLSLADLGPPARLFSAFAGLVLLQLSLNLARRKTVAWWLTSLLLASTALGHLLKGLDWELTAVSSVLLLLLIRMRPLFSARSDPPSIRRGIQILALALAGTLLYGTLGLYLLDRHYAVAYRLPSAALQTLQMFFSADSGGLQPRTPYGHLFAGSIHDLGFIALLYALLQLLQPVVQPPRQNSGARERAAQLVQRHATSVLAETQLSAGKEFWFDACHQGVVSYQVSGRCALALGDPVGPPETIRSLIRGFSASCLRQDWIPCFYQVSESHREVYQEEGYRLIAIGQEAIVDLTSFTLKGAAGKRLRPALNRLTRTGHRAALLEPPLEPALVAELQQVSEAWLRRVKGKEKRFSMGCFDLQLIRRQTVATVRNQQGRITAFATVVGSQGWGSLGIDLMRTALDSEPGSMDFLLIHLLQTYQQRGASRFSLGLAALAGSGQEADASVADRALSTLASHLERFYAFRGLQAFKAKYASHWENRYLAVPHLHQLYTAIAALIRAESGETLWDYLRWD